MEQEGATPEASLGAGSLTRPQVDLAWLEQLRAHGLVALLPSPPSPPPKFWQGVEEFNQGAYWQAHETWEPVWRAALYPLRLFYYALIKLAVGLLHLGRHNATGARQQLVPAVRFLEPFAPCFLGVQTDTLLEAAQERLRCLQGRRPAWEELARLPRPQVQRLSAPPGNTPSPAP